MKTLTLTKITLFSIWISIGLTQISVAQGQPGGSPPSSGTPGSITDKPGQPPTGSPTPAPAPEGQPTGSPPPSSAPDKPQVPIVTDPQPPQVINPGNPQPSSTAPDSTVIAATSNVKIKCDDLSTIVQKGERQASLFNWRTNHFGAEFTPTKRCQLVSERLQKTTDKNGGTLKGLQLGSGTLNSQPVICVMQAGENKCTNQNLLFTLKPENAKQSQSVIAKILTFAEDGSTTIDESSGGRAKPNTDLGSWERKAFPESKKRPVKTQNNREGF
jgi:Circadian oscillating protein COP23